MSSAISPKCKLCRREGVKLMLKGDRCFLDKCAFETRSYAPGQHGANARRKRLGGGSYAEQLREKQKIKRTYGMEEGQFRNLFDKALHMKGMTGENFLRLLELRLDNIAFRMGFAPSRRSARQLVGHGHFQVNGRRVNVPSFTLKAGDTVTVSEQSNKLNVIHAALQSSRRGSGVEWLNVDKVKLTGSVIAVPSRDQIPTPVNEQLVVELFSK